MNAPRPTSTLAADVREALAIGWPEGDHAEPNVFTDALAALDALVARVTDLEAQVEYTDRALTNMTEWHNEAMARLRAAEAQVAALRDQKRAQGPLAQKNEELRAEVAALTAQLENEAAGVDVALQNARLLNIARDLEAQVAALTQERDAARLSRLMTEGATKTVRRNAEARAEAAEAQVAALTQERDEYAERLAWHRDERDAYLKGNLWVGRAADEQRRAEAAEAEVQRLREEREGYALLAEDEAVRGEYHAEGLDERGIYGGKSHEPIEERPVDRRHPDYADDPWLAEDTPKGGAA